jgi:hypothetical protein
VTQRHTVRIATPASTNFDFIGQQGLVEERARPSLRGAKKDPDRVFVNVLRFAKIKRKGWKRKRDKPGDPQKLHQGSQTDL